MIYLLLFAISTLLIYIAEKKKYNKYKTLLISFAILIPSVIAGIRNSSVGTDVNVYGIVSYRNALQYNNYISYIRNCFLRGDNDPGFYSLIYLISRLFKDYHWGLFFYELITLLFTYFGFSRIKKLYNIPVYIGMFLFYLEIYNISLNAMRQIIATSIVLLATSYLFENKYKMFLIWVTVAFTFHGGSISSMALLPIYHIVKIKNPKISNQILGGVFVIICFLLIILSLSNIVTYLVSIGILRPNYLKYIRGGIFTETTGSFSVMVLLIETVYMSAIILHFGKLKKRNMQSIFYVMVCGLVFFIRLIAPTMAQYLSRASYYFLPIQIIALISIPQCYNKKSQKIVNLVLIALSLSTWIFQFVIKGSHETIPYQFFWS